MKYAEKQKAMECYQKHKDMIFKLAWAYCKDTYQAEDVFQEVFYKYLVSHPRFKTTEHEKAWFIRTTVNICKNFLKQMEQRYPADGGLGQEAGRTAGICRCF